MERLFHHLKRIYRELKASSSAISTVLQYYQNTVLSKYKKTIENIFPTTHFPSHQRANITNAQILCTAVPSFPSFLLFLPSLPCSPNHPPLLNPHDEAKREEHTPPRGEPLEQAAQEEVRLCGWKVRRGIEQEGARKR